jgi:chemotaxis protein methyltransferase CheR
MDDAASFIEPASLDSNDRLSQRDFKRLAEFIQGYSGIRMPANKATLVEGRLRRRMRALGMPSLARYCRHVFDEGGLQAEAVPLIDAMTTNKTDFFREAEHFRVLTEAALPRLLADRRAGSGTVVKFWSAACSIGAEAYTLAMVFAEFAQQRSGQQRSDLRAAILGTDISTEVLRVATSAIYPEAAVAPVPMELRRRYLLRSRDAARAQVRIVPALRQMAQFVRLNLMQDEYPADSDFDVIFCRNILIYFEPEVQHAVLLRLCRHLRRGGFLFLGHTESLAGFQLPLQGFASTVFRRA